MEIREVDSVCTIFMYQQVEGQILWEAWSWACVRFIPHCTKWCCNSVFTLVELEIIWFAAMIEENQCYRFLFYTKTLFSIYLPSSESNCWNCAVIILIPGFRELITALCARRRVVWEEMVAKHWSGGRFMLFKLYGEVSLFTWPYFYHLNRINMAGFT